METGKDENLKLYGINISPLVFQIILTLKLKGINNYAYFEETGVLKKKPSRELLNYNPVYKKVPVLVHNGEPIIESSIIMEYIDENWKQGSRSLLPQNPMERANARIWVKFAHQECFLLLTRMVSATVKGQGAKMAEKLRHNLKTLESGLLVIGYLEGRRFFGGEEIGFADIAIGWIGMWATVVGEVVGHKLLDEMEIPFLSAYFIDFVSVPIVKECLPPRVKLVKYFQDSFQLAMAALNRPRL